MVNLPFAIPFLGALVPFTTASPVSTSTHLEAVARSQKGITWGPCNKTEFQPDAIAAAVPGGFQCATLEVPLDYTDKNSDQQLTLSLIKIPAANKPPSGKTKSVLFNFGGPGLEARSTLLTSSRVFMMATGGIYDLVAFDPRGTANTIPFTCSDDFFTDYVQLQSGQNVNDNSTTTLRRLWSTAQAFANRCADHNQETKLLDKIATPAVARNFMSVVNALQEDGMLRYWGISYGTVLGATLLSLFPDKVDKVVLDGVENPHQYYNQFVETEELSDGDKQFSAIFPACVENRDACPLAQRSPKATAQELEDQVWKLLDHVRTQPLVYGSQVIDYTSIEQSIVQASFDYYDNNQLTNLTASFALYLDLAENKTVPPPPPSEPSKKSQVMGQFPSSLAQYGIQCLDRNKRLLAGATLEEFLSASAELYGSSRTMAASDILLDMICTNWKIDPPERFNSDFNIKPNKPVLLMGNMADAHTSVRGAYNVSSTIEDSAVLEIDGYGHTSLFVPSSCSVSTAADYWLQGNLPKNGTHCPSNSTLFGNVTWADVLMKLASEQKNKRSLPLDL